MKLLKNDVLKKSYDELLSYYKSNHVDDSIYTILMDEPDQNLDIDNYKQIFTILEIEHEDTQIITSIHNPLLYKLSKNKNVNFIELTNQYMNNIIQYMEDLLKS